jgi:solute carrier family 24 (sodium/potassium/calcium exchanger), member 6
MLHVLVLPVVVLAVAGMIDMMLFGVIPLAIILLLISIAFAIAVHLTSSNSQPPNYHWVFAVGSFIGSVTVIYVVAKEVVSVMRTIGVLTGLTDSMVGLSILAWGNSVGDLFSSIALARQGYQQMAFASCFGGPIFSKSEGVETDNDAHYLPF